MLKRLARGEERWLLVLDNVDSPGQLPDCLPQAGNGRVLVTSRNRAVREFAPVLPLDVFDPETAIAYLTERAQHPMIRRHQTASTGRSPAGTWCGDLRLLAALLHVIRYVERIGAQCANIAKLVPLSGNQPPKDEEIVDAIERIAQRARPGHAVQRGVSRARRYAR